MYYIGDIYDNLYGVVDTSDNIEEFYTKDEVFDIVNKGIAIQGVSDNGIDSVLDRIKIKHDFSGIKFIPPISVKKDYNILLIGRYFALFDLGNNYICDIDADKLKYYMSHNIHVSNVLGANRVYDIPEYFIKNNEIVKIYDFISSCVSCIAEVLEDILDICSNEEVLYKDAKDILYRGINKIYYNNRRNSFILKLNTRDIYIEIKYGLANMRSSMKLFDNSLGKDLRLRDTLYRNLYRNDIKDVKIYYASNKNVLLNTIGCCNNVYMSLS